MDDLVVAVRDEEKVPASRKGAASATQPEVEQSLRPNLSPQAGVFTSGPRSGPSGALAA